MNIDPIKYGASYKSTTLLAANTAETVFSAAANVRGAFVHQAAFACRSTTANSGAGFLAKASAPVNVTDGDAICAGRYIGSQSTEGVTCGALDRDIFIPAGKGLYFITQAADASQAVRSALYTLL